MRLWHRCALVLLMLALWPATASAHTRRVAYVTVDSSEDGATVVATLRAIDLTGLQATGVVDAVRAGPRLAHYLPTAFELSRGGEVCPADDGSFHALATEPGKARFSWRVRCANAGAMSIRGRVAERIIGHITFVRLRSADGPTSNELVLTSRTPQGDLTLGPPRPFGRALLDHVGLGVTHILSGWDHLVFVLLLLLAARDARSLALTITGFTVGHSATLAMAALGYATPRVATVEALIALSIVWLACEIGLTTGAGPSARLGRVSSWLVAASALPLVLTGMPVAASFGVALFGGCWFALSLRAPGGRASMAVAALFGLVHGFGFAGVLREASLGGHELIPGLLGFNLGVELGQLAVVALAYPLWLLAKRTELGRRRTLSLGAALGAGLGAFWLVGRLFV